MAVWQPARKASFLSSQRFTLQIYFGRVSQFQQQLQFVNGLFDILPSLATWLVMPCNSFDHDGFQILQVVRFDKLHRLDRAVAIVVSAHLRI